MLNKIINRQDRARLLKERLTLAMQEASLSQAKLSRLIGADRSTISQLLNSHSTRLPSSFIVAECALALGVSADWLLGLSEGPERAADVPLPAVSMPKAPRAPIDQQILAWQNEARGYKIRHVPGGLPDIFKTHDILIWEYEPSLGRTADQAIGAVADRLEWLRGSRSDYEIALPLHELESLANGDGYYRGLKVKTRLEQISRMKRLISELYPNLRVHLYEARRIYSAPLTIYGPILATVYLGQNNIVFRDIERVDAITSHFDQLIREAVLETKGLEPLLASYEKKLSAEMDQ